jgi:hypothetical protein
MPMRIRTGCFLVICCCAALAACTAAGPEGPDTTVSTPAVGRPPAPQSAQGAFSSEAFTPYAGLGAASDDGLAPGDTDFALHTACMTNAGYGQYADSTSFLLSINRGLAFAQPFGSWGYLGTTLAAQYGFNVSLPVPGGGNPGSSAPPSNPYADLPAGPQAAAAECFTIVNDFNNAQFATSMAGIEAMNNAISADVLQDPDVKNATKAWSACMARNGYSTTDANTLANQEQVAVGLIQRVGSSSGPAPGSGPTPAQNKAQIAAAVADADCTKATDLAGIYFAVQASYEQQGVTANQQALGAAVRQYKASYASELVKLPALLRTAKAQPPARRGSHAG